MLGTSGTCSTGVANDVLELDTGLPLPLVEDCVRDVDLEAAGSLSRRASATR